MSRSPAPSRRGRYRKRETGASGVKECQHTGKGGSTQPVVSAANQASLVTPRLVNEPGLTSSAFTARSANKPAGSRSSLR